MYITQVTTDAVISGNSTVAHLFLIHTGNVTSDKIVVELPMAAKYKENRKLWESFPLIQFPTTSFTKPTLTSQFTSTKTSATTLLYKESPDLLNTWLLCMAK